jgi:hypothetical protein
MDYQVFYRIIRRYVNKKISRERFLFDWRTAQREQGIKAGDLWKK